jgi:hypothetical protein
MSSPWSIDLIAPRVPSCKPREQVLPARREILHFAKNDPRVKKFAFRLKSRCADAADRLAVSRKKMATRPHRSKDVSPAA